MSVIIIIGVNIILSYAPSIRLKINTLIFCFIHVAYP